MRDVSPMTKPTTATKPTKPTRRAALASLALLPACRRAWSPPEADPTARSQVKPDVPGAQDWATYEEKWFNTSCAQCPAACGIRVRVVEGRAVGIEGNRANPLNSGGIGVRGLSGLQALYDPDRVRTPLRRIGGVLVPVTWDDALDHLARELRTTPPERLLVMSGEERGFTHELLARLATALGTGFVDGSASHSAPLARAMEATLGVREEPAYDWERARAILSLEAGLLEDSCRSIYFARLAAELRRGPGRRARFVHAGPAFDLAAYNADRWLRIRPGTAGALALALAHVLLRDGTYDRDVADRARGLEDFRALVADMSPAKVSAITGVAAREIEALAAELWDSRPVAVVVDERSLSFTNGVDTARAAFALTALLGGIEDTLRLAPAAPFAPWPALPPVAAPPPAVDAASVALLYHANPAYARAQPQQWREALARIPLVVSFSPFLDETVMHCANLVLPDHTYLERFDVAVPAPGLPRAVAGLRRPVVAPLHETRATGDVIIDLAHRLGGAVAAAFPWPTAKDAFEERLLGLHAAERGTLVEARPRAFLDRLAEIGFWADADLAPARPVDVALPATWTEPAWDGDPARFPLALLAYRPLGYAEGSGANQPWLHSLRSRPGLSDWTLAASLSPHDLPHVSTGELVRVTSPHGSLVLPAHVDPRIAPGCVAIPTGGGHDAFGRWARGFGVNVMELLPPGVSILCATRVRVEVA